MIPQLGNMMDQMPDSAGPAPPPHVGGKMPLGRPARTVPLVGRRHPARVDRQQRLQELHLRPALPQAAVRPLRGGGGEAHSRRAARSRRVDRPGRAPALRAGAGAVGRHPAAGHEHRGDPEQGVRGAGGAERRAGRRPRRHRLQRRTQARRRPQPRHRARAPRPALLPSLAPQRPHGRARPPRPRLRVPDRAVRRRRRQEGRRVLHAADGGQAHRGAAGAGRRDAHLRPHRRLRRHADRMCPPHRAAGGQSAQPDASRPGEEPRHLGHLQDEHAAPRAARRPHREGRYDPGPEAGGGRRAAAVRPGDRQSAVQPRRMGPRGGRERRLRALPVRRAAEDQGRSGVRPAHGGGTEHHGPARRRHAPRRAVPWRRGGEDPPRAAAGGPVRGGHRPCPEPLLRHRHPGVHPGARPEQAGGAQGQGAVHRRFRGVRGGQQPEPPARPRRRARLPDLPCLRRRGEVRAGRAARRDRAQRLEPEHQPLRGHLGGGRAHRR